MGSFEEAGLANLIQPPLPPTVDQVSAMNMYQERYDKVSKLPAEPFCVALRE